MGCFHFIIKYTLYIINLIFVVAGIAIVAAGAVALVYLQGTGLDFFCIIVIVLGCIVFFVAFSGCCGAVSEVKCLLIAYATFMVLMAAGKIYITVFLNNNLDSLQDVAENFVNDSFSTNDVLFHMIEYQLECCGTTGPDSYNETQVGDQVILPKTCCPIGTYASNDWNHLDNSSGFLKEEHYTMTCSLEDVYHDGCTKIVGCLARDVGKNVANGLIGIIVFEVVAMASAIYLCRSINKTRILER